jgi:hypothetical protein
MFGSPLHLVRHALLLVSVIAVPIASSSQESPDPDHWKVEGEIGASVFFGSTSQTVFNTRLATATRNLPQEFSADAAFTYGEASTPEGEQRVNKRSWRLGTSLDALPDARFSPFIFGRAEGSWEKRIDLRYNLGAGGKLSLVTSQQGRLDLSVSMLAERTLPSARAPATIDDQLEARWSTRLRGRRSLSEGRVTLQTETHYQPRFNRVDDFTLTSTSSFGFRLNEVVSLKLTFVDNYDSGAVERGAHTNNDGQLFFSVLSAF